MNHKSDLTLPKDKFSLIPSGTGLKNKIQMKKLIIVASVVSLLSSCGSDKMARYNDDIYANPTEERAERARIAAERKKQEEARAKQEAEERAAELAAQKAKDDANPMYKDPSYSDDDYYDYEYSSRIRRFNNPVAGIGYYDNYYTNYYYYNGNPAMYGTSIYSSYNYWGPSYYNYNAWPSSYFGVGFSWGSPNYNAYNPYGFYGYNPWYGGGYNNAYWQGYNNGYANGYNNGYWGYPYGYSYGYPYGGYGYPYGGYCNNGWGYYNIYDVNSGYNNPKHVGPRGSHDGGNSGRRSNPRSDEGIAQKFIQQQQVAMNNTPKFNYQPKKSFNGDNNYNSGNGSVNDPRPNMSGNTNKPLNENGGVEFNTYGSGPGRNTGGNNPNYGTQPKNTINSGGTNEVQFNSPGNTNNPKNTINSGNNSDAQFNNGNTQPVKPVKNRNYNDNNNNNNTPKGNIFDSGSPSFNNGSSPSNNSSSPSNNGGRSGGNSGGGTIRKPR
jgi:hypothetical protein